MISWLKIWTNQIIVTVIIVTILEMLLPEGSSKKYIKMVIGIYILFVIINPLITKITGKNIEINDFDYKKYFETTVETSSDKLETDNLKLIENTYKESIKEDLKNKLKQKGYILINCNLEIANNNSNEYGTIKKIDIKIKKQSEEKSESNNIEIKNVEINVNNKIDSKEKSDLTEKEKKLLIEYISSEYSIDPKSIYIN